MRRYPTPAGRVSHRGDHPGRSRAGSAAPGLLRTVPGRAGRPGRAARPAAQTACPGGRAAFGREGHSARTGCRGGGAGPGARPDGQAATPTPTGAGRGRGRAGGRGGHRMGAAPGLASIGADRIGADRIGDPPADRENRRRYRARQRRGIHALLVRPRYRGQVELHRQLRLALATGDRAREGGRGRDRHPRLDHPFGRLDPGDLRRAPFVHRQPGHRSASGQGERAERIRRDMARSHGPGRCGARGSSVITRRQCPGRQRPP